MNYKSLISLTIIVLLAGFLRLYKLGSNPPSLDWDEVSLGYNAWSLLATGHDEFGNSWPLTIRSFGDYKPPLYAYVLIPILHFFGQTEIAIRLPSAIAGILTVIVTYFLANELLPRATSSKSSLFTTGSLTSFLLAISPWHLQFSRIAFEANVGLFFFLTSVWLLLRWIHTGAPWNVLLSSIFGSGALLSYHSTKIVLPLLTLVLVLNYRHRVIALLMKQKMVALVAASAVFGTVGTILFTIFVQHIGQSRFQQTSLFTIDELLNTSQSRVERFSSSLVDRTINHRFGVYSRQILKGYLDHFDFQFWFLEGDRIDRHRAPSVGLLYFSEFIPLVVGLLFVVWGALGKNHFDPSEKRKLNVILLWFLVAPAASSLTGGTPSAVRSLLFLPVVQLFVTIGIVVIIRRARRIGRMSVLLFCSLFLILACFEFGHYLHQYYVHAPIEYAPAWQYGYKQAVERIMREKQQYSEIVMTTTYDQPYIYVLWYGRYDPGYWVNSGEFNKGFDTFRFTSIDWQNLKAEKGDLLVVGNAREMGGRPELWAVPFPDGSDAFVASNVQ